MIKEPTASVFIVRQDPGQQWRAALVWHPRLECWLPAGGHVEQDETTAEAAIREAREETGLDIQLTAEPATPLPTGYRHSPVPAPLWVTEMPARPDSHTAQRHIHIDHVYLATTCDISAARAPEHEVRWFTAAELASAPLISEDSRLMAVELLAQARQRPDPPIAAIPQPALNPGSGTGQYPLLIVIRGNSASGKSSVAAKIRARYGRGLSIVSQDNLRRVVLRERDIPGGANITLIDLTARHAIRSGYHVIVEGILRADYYGPMLTALVRDHPGRAYACYLDVPFEETLRRHQHKPQCTEYGETEMRQWYRERDLLPNGIEHIITAESSLDDTVSTIITGSGLHIHQTDHTRA